MAYEISREETLDRDQDTTVAAVRPARRLRALRERTRLLTLAGLAGGLALSALIVALALRPESGAPAAPPTGETYTVTRRNLEVAESVSGTLGYDSSKLTVANRLGGIVTALPKAGSTIAVGAVIYRVEGAPVVLMRGRIPAYRELAHGVSDGADVRQLETNLRELGFDPYEQMTIDKHFSYATRAAVKRWQRALGLSIDGSVELGRVVFASGPMRVGEVKATLGSSAPEVLTLSETEPTVTVKLDTSLQTIVKQGDAVTVELPGGTTARGRIVDVGRVATADENASSGAVIDVTITLNSAKQAGNLDQAPVSVSIVKERRRNVLAVPVTALVARSGGGYAVEVVRADGMKRLTPVKVGMFASGYVEVSGSGVNAGTNVVVPAG